MLSSDDARLLDRLTLGGGTALPAHSSAGVRRARSRGVGLEFHEYRHYQPGDDPRSIDWTVEARLSQLVVRVSRATGDLRLHTLVDVSASMGLGTPSKLSVAARVAAALSYIAVEHRDAVAVSTFDHDVRAFMPPTTGRGQLFRALETLRVATPGGASDIDRALLRYGAAARGPGLVVVLSDFFQPGAGLRGLQYLLHRGLTPAVIQIVSSDELHPEFDAETLLVDVEDTSATPVVVDAGMIADYQRRLEAHSESLRSFCVAQHLCWARVASNASFRDMLARVEAAGLVGAHA
jgi:uncharacterized protein (DUF58 family)